MTWRLHLTNHSIHYLDILGGDLPLLVVRVRKDMLAFHHLESGTGVEEMAIVPPQTDIKADAPEWRTFMDTLIAPNDLYLPLVHTPQAAIHTTEDGGIRLYQNGSASLHMITSSRAATLDRSNAERFVAVALERLLGLAVALDETGRVHIFQQHRRVGGFDHGFTVDEDQRPGIAIAHGGRAIYVCDGRRIVLMDSTGMAKRTRDLGYTVRLIACSPDGQTLATCDMDIGLIRVYRGPTLHLTHQRFAIDLISEATQVQLLAELPPAFVAPGALKVDNSGRLALSMSGVVCVSDLSYMDEVPDAKVTA